MKVAVNGVDLFFDVEGAKVAPTGPWMRERPTVILLPTGPRASTTRSTRSTSGRRSPRSRRSSTSTSAAPAAATGARPEHWTIETWADDLTAFCEALELERPVLLGTGIGGVVAVQQAARGPISSIGSSSSARSPATSTRARSPSSTGSAGRRRARWRRATSPIRPRLNFAEFMRVCVPLYTRTPLPAGHDRADRDEHGADGALGRDERAGLRRPRRGGGRVRCPMLLLAGEDDPATTIAGIEELVEALPATSSATSAIRRPGTASSATGPRRSRSCASS